MHAEVLCQGTDRQLVALVSLPDLLEELHLDRFVMDPRVLSTRCLQVDPVLAGLFWVGPNQMVTLGPIQLITPTRLRELEVASSVLVHVWSSLLGLSSHRSQLDCGDREQQAT